MAVAPTARILEPIPLTPGTGSVDSPRHDQSKQTHLQEGEPRQTPRELAQAQGPCTQDPHLVPHLPDPGSLTCLTPGPSSTCTWHLSCSPPPCLLDTSPLLASGVRLQ